MNARLSAHTLVSIEERHLVAKRLTWLLVFRSLMLGVLLGMTVLANLAEPELLSQPPQLLVYGAIALGFVLIFVGAIWQRRALLRGQDLQIAVQIGGDLVVAAGLIFATGGSESTFLFLFSLTTINAAALRYRLGALLTATCASLIFAGLILIIQLGLGRSVFGIEPVSLTASIRSLFFNAAALFFVATLASYVSEQLRSTGETLVETQADLGRLETLHSAVLSSLSSGLLAVNSERHVSLVNLAGTEILGLRSSEVLGRSLDELLPGLGQELGREPGQRFELSRFSEGEGVQILGCTVAPLRGAEPGIRGHVLTFQDLTEFRRLEEEMQRSERLATVGRFAAGLAHELRNPLGSLTGCVELLQRSESPDVSAEGDRDRLFAIVLREAERLNKLLTDFLQYAKPARLDTRPVDLLALVRDTVSVASRDLESPSPIELLTDPLADKVLVEADFGQLTQVVWNVLRNALQATPVDGIVRVGVQRVVAPGKMPCGRLIVEDSGVGVPIELRSKVFDPFFTTKPQGTGLGLPTAARIIEAHKGRIEIEDSDLGGARIQVDLPCPKGVDGNGTTDR